MRITSDRDGSVLHLLEMALETKVGIAFGEHLCVDAAVRAVTGDATISRRLVFENIRPALRRMALNAVLLLGEQGGAAASVGNPAVRRMTLHTRHPALGHGMMI